MASEKQVIFSLIGVGRVHPPKRQVLKDIYLSFYYGAKIGVIGPNGSGKSTLLRIISGVDNGYTGEMAFSKGYSVGFLEQEPLVDSNLTVREVCEQGLQGTYDLLKEFDRINLEDLAAWKAQGGEGKSDKGDEPIEAEFREEK